MDTEGIEFFFSYKISVNYWEMPVTLWYKLDNVDEILKNFGKSKFYKLTYWIYEKVKSQMPMQNYPYLEYISCVWMS